MALRVAPHVTVVDLTVDVDRLVERGFSELQRSQLPIVREGLVDTSRVLVIGSEADVRRSHKLQEEILVDQSVRSTLCVVVSTARGSGAAQGPAELPLAFEGEKVGVIWVGDARGVLWQPGSAKTRALTVSHRDPDGASALAALTDALRAPKVFDAAFAATSRASTASSPGSEVARPGLRDEPARTRRARGGRGGDRRQQLPTARTDRGPVLGARVGPALLAGRGAPTRGGRPLRDGRSDRSAGDGGQERRGSRGRCGAGSDRPPTVGSDHGRARQRPRGGGVAGPSEALPQARAAGGHRRIRRSRPKRDRRAPARRAARGRHPAGPGAERGRVGESAPRACGRRTVA